MEDLISRSEAIDAIKTSRFLVDAMEKVIKLPSAQAEPSQAARDIATILENEKDMRVIKKNAESESCADTISRKAAIDALTRKMVSIPTAGEKDLMGDVNRIRAEDISVIKRLPSAQPEMIREIRKWINSGNRGNADYFIVEKIEEIINKYE